MASIQDRTLRLRANKRRQRDRQKEYVADLESRLEESRREGVRVTKEVQLSAQRVVQENVLLRELLRQTGFSSESIDDWVRNEALIGNTGPLETFPPVIVMAAPGDESVQVSPNAGTNGSLKEEPVQSLQENSVHTISASSVTTSTISSPTRDSPPITAQIDKGNNCSPSGTKQVTAISSQPPRPPCQVMSLLAGNPSADITQIPIQPQAKKPCSKTCDKEVEGIECAAAYTMLMSYATSDEKMNEIGWALEKGCTSTEGGGCKVKMSVAWEVLDKSC